MKNKIIGAAAAVLLCVMLFALTGCNKTQKTIEYIKMSDETIGYLTAERENAFANSKLLLTELGFGTTMESLTARTEQKFADTETKNTLSSRDYDGEALYMLEKDDSYDCVVLYIHGGAYLFAIDKSHVSFCDSLVDTLNAKVYMPLYPLAPQSTYKEAYEFMDKVYEDILKENKPVYIMGDSAGGGFALAYTEYLKANGKQMPEKVVLISPWMDVTMENPQIDVYEYCDIILSKYGTVEAGKMWAGDTDRKDYRISPLYGDLDSLPDILMFVGNHDILYPDDMKMYEKATNTNIHVVVGEGFWHVFPLYDIPEQDTALSMIKEFVGK